MNWSFSRACLNLMWVERKGAEDKDNTCSFSYIHCEQIESTEMKCLQMSKLKEHLILLLETLLIYKYKVACFTQHWITDFTQFCLCVPIIRLSRVPLNTGCYWHFVLRNQSAQNRKLLGNPTHFILKSYWSWASIIFFCVAEPQTANKSLDLSTLLRS